MEPVPVNAQLSRRDFLKLSGMGLLGLALPNLPSLASSDDVFASQQGRVTTRLIWTYDQPSFKGKLVKMYWRDLVVPISNVTVADDPTAYNRIWYQIGDQGYAYSGTIQPVRTILNTPTLDIPEKGILAEVSVPFSDALEKPGANLLFAYRMYYSSVHWVRSAVTNPQDGKIWYQVLDDKWNQLYYAPGEHFRFLTYDELSPISPNVPDSQKRIEVHLNDQLVMAYENGNQVFAARASTGAVYLAGTYTTPTGHFTTYHKRPTRHMAAGDLTASGFDLPGVPWVMYITESGISLHGTYWHNDFGTPHSHGCINLSTEAAKWLFRWTQPVVPPVQPFAYDVLRRGTQVEIME